MYITYQYKFNKSPQAMESAKEAEQIKRFENAKKYYFLDVTVLKSIKLPTTEILTLLNFKHHLIKQFERDGVTLPKYISIHKSESRPIDDIIDSFLTSDVYIWIQDQVEKIEFWSLNRVLYTSMLNFVVNAYVFQAPQIVMVSFFFASEVLLRCVKELPPGLRGSLPMKMYEWSCDYLIGDVCPRIEIEGGWMTITGEETRDASEPEPSKLYFTNLTVSLVCLAVVTVLIYIRYQRSK